MIYSPIKQHPGQVTLWNDPARFKAIVAGRRWGKTWYVVEKLLSKTEIKNSRCGYMGPTRSQGKEIIWDRLLERCDALKWRVKDTVSDLTIKRRNGSSIEIKTAEKPGRVRGGKFRYWALDEFGEYKDAKLWPQIIRPTLSDLRGGADFIYTPTGFGLGYDLHNNAKTKPNWSAHHFRTIDSPFFQTPEGKQEIEDAREDLSEIDFAQEYLAEFRAHSGRVYYSFDRDTCHEPYEYNSELEIIVGQDFNRSPMSSGLFQEVNGKYLQFGEIFLKVGDTEKTCQEINRQFPKGRVTIIPDATGKRKTSNSSVSDFDIIESFGFNIQTRNSNPYRVDRYAAVNRAYEKGLVKVNVNNCPQTVKDRETLIYKEGTGDPDTRDPFAEHMATACDYAIAARYPLRIRRAAVTKNYA